MSPDYNPRTDSSDLASERIAMIRSYLYGGCFFHVMPTVADEYSRIPSKTRRLTHEQVCNILLSDGPWELDKEAIMLRAQDLFTYHNRERDCQVIAEAEAVGLEVLLTCDQDLIAKLGPRAKGLSIMKPTDFFTKLGIKPGAKPIWSPAPSNPLYDKNWWGLG